MKKILLLLLISIVIHTDITAQLKIGAELYSYIKMKPAFQPIAYIQTADNWHAELRYNYEDANTFSLYGGQVVSGGGSAEYSITPMLGFSTGRFTGLSFAVNADATLKKFFISSQTQYSVDVQKTDSAALKKDVKNFFYSWSEVGYNISDNFYTGIAIQYTLQTGANEFKPGFMTGLSFNKFQVPFYIFNPFHPDRYFIAGIIYELIFKKNK